MDNTIRSEYNASYTSFSGADIVATFAGIVIGELQAISYSVTREKAPIYTMGSADPRSFSRGKRGIAGSLVFTVFHKDTLEELKLAKGAEYFTPSANKTLRDDMESVDPEKWEAAMEDAEKQFVQTNAAYADEIPPFDITITMVNEYGQAAKFSLYGCEILNEGSGMSIDDITTEKACTFVARAISPLESISASEVSYRDISN
jgi:hypothetical protein